MSELYDSTIDKAKTIVKRNKVYFKSRGHFEVEEWDGNRVDVFISKRKWSCTKVKMGKEKLQGCAYASDQDEPFCEHTKAVDLWIRGRYL